MDIFFVTSNKNKFKEAKSFLKQYDINIVHHHIIYDEIRNECPKMIAISSAISCYDKLKKPLFVEDSGLFVKSLSGFPGTYSSWVHKKIKNSGIIDLLNNKDRYAEFRCAIAFTDGINIKAFTSVCKGKIAKKILGKNGFGYDPIFIPKNSKKTFAQDLKNKAKTSHRILCLKKLAKYIKR